MSRTIEIITAPTTAFDASGAVDHPANRALLAHVEPYVDAVFAAGTTAEFPGLDAAERLAVLEDAVAVLGPDRVVAHVGAPSVRQALGYLKDASTLGIHRFAAITPYYLTASDQGVLDYFRALREATSGNLYAYAFPDVACSDISPELLARLGEVGVEGIKVSGGASQRVDAYRAAAPQLSLWSGNDADLPHIVAAGGLGTVSGCSGVVPSAWARLRDALLAGEETEIAAAQSVVEVLVAALGPSISRLKFGLDLLNLPGGSTRLPIDPVSPAAQAQITAALETAGVLSSVSV